MFLAYDGAFGLLAGGVRGWRGTEVRFEYRFSWFGSIAGGSVPLLFAGLDGYTDARLRKEKRKERKKETLVRSCRVDADRESITFSFAGFLVHTVVCGCTRETRSIEHYVLGGAFETGGLGA